MGRKNKKYAKSLHQQAHEKLVGMQAFGESRSADKLTGADRNKIYSYKTYSTYHEAVMRFIKFVQKEHPDCTSLKRAKRYVNEYLQLRVDANMSNWTVAMENCALCKLYGILPDDPNRFQAPSRRREDIKRSRSETVRDKHFSEKNNSELINFVCCTGTRRNVLERLRGADLWTKERMECKILELRQMSELTGNEQLLLKALAEALVTFPDQSHFILHSKDKGGRWRLAPIVGKGKERVIERMQNAAPDELVWNHVHSAADIHSYRAQYAQTVYKFYARDIGEIPFDKRNAGSGRMYQSQVYCCKRDEKGRKLDRAALYKASKALGHNRIDVIPSNYLYGL